MEGTGAPNMWQQVEGISPEARARADFKARSRQAGACRSALQIPSNQLTTYLFFSSTLSSPGQGSFAASHQSSKGKLSLFDLLNQYRVVGAQGGRQKGYLTTLARKQVRSGSGKKPGQVLFMAGQQNHGEPWIIPEKANVPYILNDWILILPYGFFMRILIPRVKNSSSG